MRCLACNSRLSNREATRKYANTPSIFIELCNKCFSTISDEVPDLESDSVADFNDDDVGSAVEDFLKNGDYQHLEEDE